jgi:hypothetical protein
MRPRLFSFELAWADAAFAAMFPPPPRSALVHGIADMKPARFFDDALATVPLEPSLGLRIALWIVALAPLFTIRRFATITSLDDDGRERVLVRLMTSPVYAVRQLLAGLKTFGSLLYAQSPAVRKQMMTPLSAPLAATSLVRVRTTPVASSKQGEVESHEHAAE